jgi:hypothetical protein
MTEPAAQPTTSTQSPNALVFVPGISRSWGDRSLRQLADDVVASMNQLSTRFTFAAAPGDPLSYATGDRERSSRRVTITRVPTAGSDEKGAVVLDLYELDYVRTLAAANEGKPMLVRAAQVLWSLFRGTRQFLGIISPSREGKRRAQRFQLLFLFGVLALYAAFLGVLLAAILQMAVDALGTASTALGGSVPAVTPAASIAPGASPGPAATTSAAPAGAAGFFGTAFWNILRFISLASIVVWLFLPPKAKVKEGITNSATDFLTIDYYLRSGTNAPRLLGDLNGLLDALRDGRAGVAYRRIDLGAYSLGSIVAFNALFPFGSPPAPGAPIEAVHNFITIGCPFDTIRLIRPDYFKERHPAEAVPKKWFNVYTPNDILGSNFRNDDADREFDPKVIEKAMSGSSARLAEMTPPTNVPYYAGGVPQGQSIGDALFGGLQAHLEYWNAAEGGESTCFDALVPLLYGSDGTLGEVALTGPG